MWKRSCNKENVTNSVTRVGVKITLVCVIWPVVISVNKNVCWTHELPNPSTLQFFNYFVNFDFINLSSIVQSVVVVVVVALVLAVAIAVSIAVDLVYSKYLPNLPN